MAKMRWDVLAELVREHRLKKGAEIGIGKGANLSNFLLLCPEVEMLEVGIWPAHYPTEAGTSIGTVGQSARRQRAVERMKPFASRITFIEKPSLEAAGQVEDGSLDFVFIDADHSYEGCRDDIRAWAPKVRLGGFVTGHDYKNEFPGVKKAVNEIYPHHRIDADSVWIMRK